MILKGFFLCRFSFSRLKPHSFQKLAKYYYFLSGSHSGLLLQIWGSKTRFSMFFTVDWELCGNGFAIVLGPERPTFGAVLSSLGRDLIPVLLILW